MPTEVKRMSKVLRRPMCPKQLTNGWGVVCSSSPSKEKKTCTPRWRDLANKMLCTRPTSLSPFCTLSLTFKS